MPQMAGVLIGRPLFDGSKIAVELDAGQEFRYILETGAEFPGGFEILPSVFGKQRRVLLEDRSATRCIANDCVQLFTAKGFQISLGHLTGHVAHPGVNLERAAADLFLGDDDLASVAGQHPQSGFIQTRKREIGDAAGEKPHPVFALPLRGDHAPQAMKKEGRLHPGREPRDIVKPFAHQPGQYQAHLLQPQPLVPPQKSPDRRQASGIGQKVAQNKPSGQTGHRRALVETLNLRACRFHQLVVFHPRWTGGFTGQTTQTRVDVPDEVFLKLHAALPHLNHLVDAPSGGVHLDPKLAIRRTGVQAQPAADTLRVVFPLGRRSGPVTGGRHR